MIATLTNIEAISRRAKVLIAARWCFLNFGFAKTSFEDIAKRAGLSRTLLYRIFSDKEDIYRAVFVDWVVSRHPAAKDVANGPGSSYERLLNVSHLLAIEHWAEMVATPMGNEFLEACSHIDPESMALHRKVSLSCMATILGDAASAEVFLLALYGLFADQPSREIVEQRVKVLAAHFAPRASQKESRL